MLAEIVQIASKQRFDMTGVVQTVSSSRHVQTSKGDRVVADVCLLDDTNTAAADSKCKASLEFPIFFQATVGGQEPPDLVSFRDAASKGPLSFFGLEAEPQSTGIAVKTTNMFRWSPALGAKATALQKQFHSLQAVAASDTKCVSTHWEASAKVDYETLQVTQSNCFLLSLLKDVPDPGMLRQTVFQINFAQFAMPQPGSTILTNDKSRVFLATTLYDASGAVSVVVREKAALKLASVDSKEKFEGLHAEGHLSFPLLASARVLLTAGTASQEGSKPENAKRDLRVLVVEAEEQSFDQKPTQAVNQLMEFMKGLRPPCRGLVPSTLRNFCASQHYALAVRMSTGAIRNGDKALFLVATQSKSTATALENDTFRVVTDDVVDLADSDTGKLDFTLTGLCAQDALADFKIDAPRGGKKTTGGTGDSQQRRREDRADPEDFVSRGDPAHLWRRSRECEALHGQVNYAC